MKSFRSTSRAEFPTLRLKPVGGTGCRRLNALYQLLFLGVPLRQLLVLSLITLFNSAHAVERLFPVRDYQLRLPAILNVQSDVRGTVPPLDIRKQPVKGWVLVFMGTQCRLVRDYLNRLREWAEDWSKKGIVVVGVFSHKHETSSQIARFANEEQIPFLVLHDQTQEIAQLTRAQMTPESFLLGEDFRILYRGRIDNQFGFGPPLPKASHSYLVAAVASTLQGKFPAPAVTDLQGCSINLGKPQKEITFNNDIGPLIYQRCTRCHRENEVGGELFKFISYETIAPHAETIAGVTEKRVMPPWPAGIEGKFRNDSSLDANEIWMLRKWAAGAAPIGAGTLAPPAVTSKEGFRQGTPTVIVAMTPHEEPTETKFFRVPPKSEEAVLPYKYFRVKTDLPEDKWLVASEIKSLVPEVVHHVNVFLMPPPHPDDWILEGGLAKAIARQIAMKKFNVDAANFDWTFRLYGRGLRRQLQLIAQFSPTEPARSMPDGYGYLIPKGAELIFECHYTPTEKERLDRSVVGLWFADKVPANYKELQVITRSGGYMSEIQIPPYSKLNLNRKIHFHADAKLLTIRPHMHMRGKSFKGILEYPDGRKQTLLHVPDYDYNWQSNYQFENPILVPKGSVLHSIYDWDNTDRLGNPDPSKHLTFGQQIYDEMGLSFPTYSYINPAETDEAEAKLEHDLIYDDKE